MKPLKEIKDEYAREQGHKDWKNLLIHQQRPEDIDLAVRCISKAYAKSALGKNTLTNPKS